MHPTHSKSSLGPLRALIAVGACGLFALSACSDDTATSPQVERDTDVQADAGDNSDVDPDAPTNGRDTGPDVRPDVPPSGDQADRLGAGASADTLESERYRVRLRVGGPSPSGRVESPRFQGTLNIGPPAP